MNASLHDLFLLGACFWAAAIPAAAFSSQPRQGGRPDPSLKLWYTQPAKPGMNEALPVGNGRFGGLIYGAPDEERIVLDEDSLWTGGQNPSGDYGSMGAYQFLGDLHIVLPGHGSFQDYLRDLDVAQALAHVAYKANGVSFHREVFASHPAQVLVVKLTADKPGSYSGTIGFTDSHGADSVVTGNLLTTAGHLNNGLKYETSVLASHQGGTLSAADGKISFSGCDSLTLYIAAGTDYAMDFEKGYRGPDPHARLVAQVESAAKKGFDKLRSEHIKDYRSLFDRISLDLGQSSGDQRMPATNIRKDLGSKQPDPEMEELLFQYGRYLMIACSRPGSVPANLQGLWSDSNTPPWNSDYHSNINIEMNYWPVEVANLSECHTPFFDLIRSQLVPWRQATAASDEWKPAPRGFAIRTSHNTMGGMGWKWDKTANAWYCQHLWEHYAFGQDKRFLRETAYPIMKETCEFWEDHLKELPDGRLVVPNAWSPEHGPEEDGVSYCQEILYNLFSDTIEASTALEEDGVYRAKLAAMRDRLAQPGIGSWGQLLEWMTEKKNDSEGLDTPNDHHRHTSHLFGVYPGNSITPDKTPKLAEAAKVSLRARGDTGDVREWSFAWRTALWARLGEAEAAHGQLMQLLADRNSCPNLFGLHPPMQIDGNFGITAAMCEMLVQSQDGPIRLLPALPKAWASGSVHGLKVRGGYTVDIRWAEGKLIEAKIGSATRGNCTILYGSSSATVGVRPGQVTVLDAQLRKVTK